MLRTDCATLRAACTDLRAATGRAGTQSRAYAGWPDCQRHGGEHPRSPLPSLDDGSQMLPGQTTSPAARPACQSSRSNVARVTGSPIASFQDNADAK